MSCDTEFTFLTRWCGQSWLLVVAEGTISCLSLVMYFHSSTVFGLTKLNAISEDAEFIRECP